MRDCFQCNGKGERIFEEDGSAEECTLCEGTCKIEEGCYCAAREPFECCCGGWDDFDIDNWYGED